MGSKKEINRIGHKAARQKEKEALRDRLPDTARGRSWSNKIPQPHVPDSAVTGGPRRKKNKKKWCKGHVGREHVWVWKRKEGWYGTGWYCDRCTKRYWGTPPGKEVVYNSWYDKIPDHWDYSNITRRLAGYECLCAMCKEKSGE